MLQQTRASVVVDYFQKWMQIFPSVEALAAANEEEVVKVWEGLGYYSRARNLHRGAKQVVEEYGGKIPDREEALLKIKGIGPYTAGAILSFAFGKKAAAIDANVRRVLARFFGEEKDLQERLLKLLPEQDSPIIMEGLIELGATICGQKPLCALCPLVEGCVAKKGNLIPLLPAPKKRKEITDLYRFVACIECEGCFLLKQGEQGKVMEGLWEFPYIECEGEPIPSHCLKQLEKNFDLELTLITPLERCKHHFTRYRSYLFPYLIVAKSKRNVPCHAWKTNFQKLPFSSGHRKIIMLVT